MTNQLNLKNRVNLIVAKSAIAATQPESLARAVTHAHALVDDLFRAVPVFQLSIERIWQVCVSSSGLLHAVDAATREDVLSFQTELTAILHARGYRPLKDILTWQEHKLVGSSLPLPDGSDPYIPSGILEGKLTLDEARLARLLKGYGLAFPDAYQFDPDSPAAAPWMDEVRTFVRISMEDLNLAFRTVRDPRVAVILNENTVRTVEPEIPRVDTFPFRRD